MKLITVYFDREGDYSKLLKVFEKSAKQFMPNCDLEIIKVPVPSKEESPDPFRDTYFGFMPTMDYVLNNSNECIAVADVDLMFTGSIENVFDDYDFDMGFTVRDKPKYNTGIWFYKPSENAIDFIKKWKFKTKQIYNNFNIDIVHDYGGIDQASLTKTIEEDKKTNILELPCNIWNAEQRSWKNITEDTKVIHIKSGLRDVCLNKRELTPKQTYLQPIVNKWRNYL